MADFEAQVIEELRQFVTSQFELNSEDVLVDKALSDLGIDSFSLLELVVFAERKWGMKFPLENLTPANLSTVSTFARCIAKFDRGQKVIVTSKE